MCHRFIVCDSYSSKRKLQYVNDTVGMWLLHEWPSQKYFWVLPPRSHNNSQNRHPPRTQRPWNILENSDATRVDRRELKKISGQTRPISRTSQHRIVNHWTATHHGKMFADKSGIHKCVRLWQMNAPVHIKMAWWQEFFPIVVTMSDFSSGHFSKFMLELLHTLQTTGIMWQSVVNSS